jgi:hypothetical protein
MAKNHQPSFLFLISPLPSLYNNKGIAFSRQALAFFPVDCRLDLAGSMFKYSSDPGSVNVL